MASNTSILLANPDFNSIKGSLKAHMQKQAIFKDYDFDGSNLNALLDVLATNTYQGAFMKNMIASEMFMGTAQLSNSIYSHAKEMTYVPRSARSASTRIDIEIIPFDQPSTIIVPKDTLFTGTAGSRSLTFSTKQAYALDRDANGKYIGEIEIFEGLYVTDVYTSNLNTVYTINNKNVDTDSLEVTVTNDAGTTTYMKRDSIIGLKTPTDPVFYISINHKGFFEIYFGDNIIGAKPSLGDVVNIRYRVSSTELGNNVGLFRNSTNIAGYSNVIVKTPHLSSGGASIENARLTQKYAPLANQIRDRAFTTDDYSILLRQAFPEIRAINVFGGEDLDPPQFSKVAISITTDDSLTGISNNLKQKYTTFIKSKNPTIINPVFITPELIQVKVRSKVYYDFTKTNSTESDIKNSVVTALKAYDLSQLNNFNTILRKSKLTNVIDLADSAINGNETTLEITTIVDHILLRSRAKTINLYNHISRCSNSSMPSIYSTNFKYDSKICRLVDTVNGELFIETSLNSAPALIQRVGTVDYENGVINLFPVDIQELYTTNLKIFVNLLNEDIKASRNALIQLDFSELQIETQAQKR